MSTLIIALICFAVAFVSGGLLSKAYFLSRTGPQEDVFGNDAPAPVEHQNQSQNETHAESSGDISREKLNSLLQAQRIRYRKRMVALNNVIKRHEETRDQIREKLQVIEQKHEAGKQKLAEASDKLLEAEQQNEILCAARMAEAQEGPEKTQPDTASDSNELAILRIERDELAARIKRLEHEATLRPEPIDIDQTARLRAATGELREKLTTQDRRVHDLECALQECRRNEKLLNEKLETWKQRVSPLTRKLRQQKDLITRMTHESEPVKPQRVTDNLKAIHGIGPALERRLHEHGICQYRQLAALTPEALAEIARKLSIAPSLIERDTWILQAQALHEQEKLAKTG
ncbi:MAG: hypothetical protein OEU86_04885 [Gammaproteobacteria bacterium]|nr:hypothetical protein [Gammaproteobacteria bacterium]